jgi:hypothetical protein
MTNFAGRRRLPPARTAPSSPTPTMPPGSDSSAGERKMDEEVRDGGGNRRAAMCRPRLRPVSPEAREVAGAGNGEDILHVDTLGMEERNVVDFPYPGVHVQQ